MQTKDLHAVTAAHEQYKTVYSFLVQLKALTTAILRNVHINIMHKCKRIVLSMSRGCRKSRIVQVYTKSRTNVPGVINLLGIYADSVGAIENVSGGRLIPRL